MAKELSQRFANMNKTLQSFAQKEELEVLTLDELKTRTIKFGKTKVGQTYAEVVAKDPGYCTWFLGTWGDSKKDTHLEFLRFLQLHTEHMEDALNHSQEPSRTQEGAQEQGHAGTWEILESSKFFGPRRGGRRGLVTSGADGPTTRSRRSSQPREQHGVSPVPDHAPADPNAASHESQRSTVNSSTQQGHMISQVCEGLSAYIHYMGKCSGNHSSKTHRKPNWVLKEMQEYMREKGHERWKGHPRRNPNIDVLEIYCSEESQITQQGEKQGIKTVRFGLAQGDLATYEGRSKLYDCLLKGMPRDIWMSPACKAWCRWNQFNATRSPELAKKVMRAREQDEVHLMLCCAVFWYQVQEGNHFHLEQPKGSHMIFQEAIEPIVQNTWHASCDQCTAGQLKNPETQKYLKKGMQFFTTSKIVAQTIDQYQCQRGHPHDPVAGTFRSKDGRRHSLAQYTELYTAVFASRVCRAMLASSRVAEQSCVHHPFVEYDIYTNEEEEENIEQENKRRRLLLKQSPPSAYENPTNSDKQIQSEQVAQPENPSTQNPGEETKEGEPQEISWEEVIQDALAIAPRVGTKNIEHGDLKDKIQKLCPRHQVRVVLWFAREVVHL